MYPEEEWGSDESSDLEDRDIARLGDNKTMAERVKYPLRNSVPWYLIS